MQTRKYRRNPASTLLYAAFTVLCLAGGLFLVIAFFLPPAGSHPPELVFALLLLLSAALGATQVIFGRDVLVVTDDGLRGFQLVRWLVIPWSSVHSFTVKYSARSNTYLAYVTLDSGKRVPLGEPKHGPERVERFAAELTEALREHREQAPRDL
jgi:hypothetical protein